MVGGREGGRGIKKKQTYIYTILEGVYYLGCMWGKVCIYNSSGREIPYPAKPQLAERKLQLGECEIYQQVFLRSSAARKNEKKKTTTGKRLIEVLARKPTAS